MNNGLQMQFFSCQHRETFFQVDMHLVAKGAYRAGAGPIAFTGAIIQYVTEEIQVGLQRLLICGLRYMIYVRN